MELMVLEGNSIGPKFVKSETEIISVLKDNYGLNIYPKIYDIDARIVKEGK
ncbi:MAG: hypothetical protein QXV17_06350 [Candidatus Micrarchaeaceae archaeon]